MEIRLEKRIPAEFMKSLSLQTIGLWLSHCYTPFQKMVWVMQRHKQVLVQ